jgi:tRNA-specific 2-thiouridylase
MSAKLKVYVGMSGGVDSSVTAALLREQGYDVTGVYMKNWSQDLPGFVCPWKEDYQDAKRVAVQLGIPFKMYDFEKEYRSKVVDYMIDGYKAGLTPNPDIMCNQEVKFKIFLEAALEDGADLIATGHYARIVRRPTSADTSATANPSVITSTPVIPAQAGIQDKKDSALTGFPIELGMTSTESAVAGIEPGMTVEEMLDCRAELHVGLDVNKDQSYFLYRVTEDALKRSLMPIGEYEKPQVRELAKKFGLATAEKKDSQGICFVGKVGIKEFLQQFVTTEPGVIIDQHGNQIGEHDGALFYTIGQRQGLHVGGGMPYYVVGKSMDKNEVYVTTDLQDARLWSNELTLTSPHWINQAPTQASLYGVRTRYRADLIAATGIQPQAQTDWQVTLRDEVRALTPGQSAVLYEKTRVVGGGLVAKA